MTQAQPTLFPVPLIEDTPHNRRMLRRALFELRQRCEQGCGYDPEMTPWVIEQHRRLIDDKSSQRMVRT